jgi:TRAP-type transport system periplasmic protein
LNPWNPWNLERRTMNLSNHLNPWHLLSLVIILILPVAVSAQQKVNLRLATVAPDGSIWHQALRQFQTDLGKVTDGRVNVRLFAGGVQGSEDTMTSKMRLNQLQAGAFTVVGLSRIDPAFNVFAMPFFFEGYDELDHVIEKLGPVLKQRLEERNFVLLNWGHGGWVQVFSKRPVRTLDDLKRTKLFTSAGDDTMVQWYKRNGFQPVALTFNDIFTGLQTGMIEAVPFTPIGALAFPWYRETPNMLDIGVAPVVGATLVTRRAWDAMSEGDRRALLEAAERAEERLHREVPKQDDAAVVEMERRGLTVTRVRGTAEAEAWRQAGEAFAAGMRGSMVPAEIYDLAVRERNAFRESRGGSR